MTNLTRSLITTILAVPFLIATTTPGRAAAPVTMTQTVDVSLGDVRIVRQGTVDFIDLRGGTISAPDGLPDLPTKPLTFRLPEDMEITGVSVRILETHPLRGTFHLATAHTVNSDGVPLPGGARENLTPASFDASGFYPADLATVGYQGRMRGRALGGIVYTPFRWREGDGRLEVITRAEFTLTLEPVTRDRSHDFVALRKAPWADARFDAEIARLVVNPTPPTPDEASGRLPGEALVPLINSAAPLEPTFRPSVNGSPVEMVIITNETMQSEYQRLADWKTRSGIPTVVRTLTWIKANYPNGVDTQETIRNFIRDAAQKWGTIWILLGGDTDVIPTRYGKTQFFGGEEIPTDLYYQAVDGTWNADGDADYGEGFSTGTDPGDSADLYPEVWIGRLPSTTLSQAQTLVNKILAYEVTPLRNGYQDDYLALAEVLFPQTWNYGDAVLFDGADVAQEAITHLPGNYRVVKLYENCPQPAWPTCILENKPTVVDSLNKGFGFVHHVGHGYINTMAVGYSDFTLTNADADAASNGNETFFLYAINCTSSAIDFNCISERFILNSHGGSVASIGSTRFDFPSTGWAYQTEFYRLVFMVGIHELGHAAAACKLPYVPQSVPDNTNRWTQFTQIYFGDPSMPLFTAPPKDLAVTHAATHPLGAPTFTVTVMSMGSPVDSARVCLNKVNDEYVVGYTNPSGVAVLPFVPDSTGTFQVTVVADDCVPYQANATVTTPASPYLYAAGQMIDDDSVGSSIGNNNQKIDAGETIELKLPVRNRGASTGSPVTATLTTSATGVTILDNTSSYPSVASGTQVNPTDPFVLSFARTITDRTEPKVHVTWQSGATTIEEDIVLYLHAPVFEWFREFPRDTTGNGNGNGVFAPGEDVTMRVELRNRGLGQARTVTAILRTADPSITISDSTVTFGTIAGGGLAVSRPSDTFRFQMADTTTLAPNGRKLTVSLYDFYSPSTELASFKIDARQPPLAVSNLVARGSTSSIALTFSPVGGAPDLKGYNIYRSSASVGPYARINQVVTPRTAYYNDEGLPPLTAFFYKVAPQDSAGNEGPNSVVVSASTTLPLHEGFPVELKASTNASVTIADLDYDGDLEILAGASEIYAIHPDGTEVYDGDNDVRTLGVLTSTLEPGYWNAPTVGDVDLDGSPEVAAVSWTASLYLWDEFGNVKPGFPKNLNMDGTVDPNPLGSVAMADIDGDGDLELFVLMGKWFFGFRYDGTELFDGDANPSTQGVIKQTNTYYSYGTPAIGDITGDGRPEVIVGMRDGKLHVFNTQTWAEMPGFPYTTGGNITSSPALGDIDNDGQLEVVFGASDSKVYALNGNGTAVPGWPQGIQLNEDFDSSPALGDLTGDGIPDVVIGASNGRLFAWRSTGVNLWSLPIKDALGNNVAVRSSPILVDVDNNGVPEVIVGDQIGRLHAFYANGTALPGFPIQTGNLIEGGPAAWDLDGDGLTEIVAESFDQKVYEWDTPWTFNKLASPWPMFHHDARHTGKLTEPLYYQVGVPEESPRPELRPFTLAQNHPNPFNPTTTIGWSIEKTAKNSDLLPMRLEVYSPTGRLVKILVDRPMPLGHFETVWDGTDLDGNGVPSGVYYYRIITDSVTENRKMVLVR